MRCGATSTPPWQGDSVRRQWNSRGGVTQDHGARPIVRSDPAVDEHVKRWLSRRAHERVVFLTRLLVRVQQRPDGRVVAAHGKPDRLAAHQSVVDSLCEVAGEYLSVRWEAQRPVESRFDVTDERPQRLGRAEQSAGEWSGRGVELRYAGERLVQQRSGFEQTGVRGGTITAGGAACLGRTTSRRPAATRREVRPVRGSGVPGLPAVPDSRASRRDRRAVRSCRGCS